MNFGPRSQVSRVGPGADPLTAMQSRISGMLADAAPFFAPAARLVRLYLRVVGLLAPEARLAWLLVGANAGIAASQFAEPVLFGRVIDALVRSEAAGAAATWLDLLPLLGAWVTFAMLTVGCGVVVAINAERLSHRRRHSVLSAYFEHVLQLPMRYHGRTHSGRLMKVMLQGTDALFGVWLLFFREHFAAFVSLLVLLPLSLLVNWRLAVLLIALTLVFALVTALVVGKTEALQRGVERHYSDLAERASDSLGNVALVQSFARVEAEVAELRGVINRLLAAQIPVLSWWALVSMLTRGSTAITMLAIFFVGTWLHMDGLASIGQIVMFMNFSAILISRLEQVVGFINRVFMETPRIEQFFDVLDTVPAVRDRPDATDLGRVRGLVEFRNVSFAYTDSRPAVAGLTFTVQPGETVALVGATGAGKTTALALLHRAFDPQAGQIAIDGIDIRDIKLSSLRHNIGVVFQEALLFNRSIAENLSVGKPDASAEEMRAAAARAQALDFIESSPQGFGTTVGERGRSLSGGERQRLSIARALLKDPPILILDEATSALDAATEVKVQAALAEVMQGRTTFVIAHRLATVRNATRILVFDGGRIVETGSFEALMARGGRFAALAQAQFIGTEVRHPERISTAAPVRRQPPRRRRRGGNRLAVSRANT
jgi:ATP-binding cassette, subfamily B, beta-glucan exporter